ncbi:unnamed protein product [Mytilus edulis]|uniref:C1q domain-containing protein n=1 Tax=Mytilus edulis TaxID=6550 RepID=A0A8S3T1X3_MYTED|nr:unnamed protein product [Mytilus edulis]
MFIYFVVLYFCGLSNGFLLDSGNISTFGGKPTYLSAAEYYGDKNQIHHDLEKLHQEQEAYRDQQEKSLNLLTNQIQQKFLTIEQMFSAQNSNNKVNETKQIIDALEQKYGELETKYTTVQGKLSAKEQMYNKLAENYTKLKEAMEMNNANLQQELLKIQENCKTETNSAVNKTLVLAGTISKLEQLKNINQLQTLQTLQGQVQTFDSRINLLTSHEQARNQDFLALYNLTTLSRHELEIKMNNQFQTLEKNLINQTRSDNEKLEKHTMKEINELANHTMHEIEQMERYHNSSFLLFQQNMDKQLQKVVVTGCTNYGGANIPAGPVKFPVIKTSVGISNLSSFQSTGKFTCQVPGYYHIIATITTTKKWSSNRHYEKFQHHTSAVCDRLYKRWKLLDTRNC